MKKICIREWGLKNLKKYNTIKEAVVACSKELNVAQESIVRKFRKFEMVPRYSSNPVGLTLNEFRAKHDVLYKMRQAVEKLEIGRILTDSEFREHLVCAEIGKYRSKADLPEFGPYKGRSGGITYWSHKSTIANLKSQGVMQ